jgi:hypothetical protein
VRAEGKARVSDVVAGECVLDSQPVWIGQSEAWSKHTGGGCGRLFHPRVSLLSGFHSDVWSSALSSRHARDDSSEQRFTCLLRANHALVTPLREERSSRPHRRLVRVMLRYTKRKVAAQSCAVLSVRSGYSTGSTGLV